MRVATQTAFDSYAKYYAIRAAGSGNYTSGVVLSQASLAATELKPTQALAGGRKYALHPSMTGLSQLFNSGKAAVQLNVGPLVVPLVQVALAAGQSVEGEGGPEGPVVAK